MAIGRHGTRLLCMLWIVLLGMSLFHPSGTLKGLEGQGGKYIQDNKTRIVSFPIVTESYLAINKGGEGILATSEIDKKSVRSGVIGSIYPGVDGFEDSRAINNSAIPGDPEWLLYLNPDAILLYAWFVDRVDYLGLKIQPISNSGSSGINDAWQAIGEVTGKKGEAERVLRLIEEMEGDIKQHIGSLAKAPTKVAILWQWIGGYVIKDSTWGVAKDLKWLGLDNVADGYLGIRGIDSRCSVEDLIYIDPDVIFLPYFGDDRQDPGHFYSNPALQSISAVLNKKVYRMPVGSAQRQLVDRVVIRHWIASVIYPEMAKYFRGKVRRLYLDIFDYAISDAEIDRLIFSRINSASFNYSGL